MAHIDIGVIRHDAYYVRSTNTAAWDAAIVAGQTFIVRSGGALSLPAQSALVYQLQPNAYHFRIPYYGSETGTNACLMNADGQATADQDLAYAAQGKIDHWIFNFFPVRNPSGNPGGAPHWAVLFAYALNQYLSSTQKGAVKFCLNIQFTFMNGHWYPWSGGSDVITQVVTLMQDPNYKKVLGNRPLLYIHEPAEGVDAYVGIDGLGGTWPGVVAGFNGTSPNGLRAAAQSVGLGNPYIVAMQDFSPSSAALNGVTSAVDHGIADAISTYVSASGAGGTWNDLVSLSASDRSTMLATGKKMVSCTTAGWDQRPAFTADGIIANTFYSQPTGAQWQAAVQAAINFANANLSACETKTLCVSAWNEISEGHTIVPTLV